MKIPQSGNDLQNLIFSRRLWVSPEVIFFHNPCHDYLFSFCAPVTFSSLIGRRLDLERVQVLHQHISGEGCVCGVSEKQHLHSLKGKEKRDKKIEIKE